MKNNEETRARCDFYWRQLLNKLAAMVDTGIPHPFFIFFLDLSRFSVLQGFIEAIAQGSERKALACVPSITFTIIGNSASTCSEA